jgi:hypothetical protein
VKEKKLAKRKGEASSRNGMKIAAVCRGMCLVCSEGSEKSGCSVRTELGENGRKVKAEDEVGLISNYIFLVLLHSTEHEKTQARE